MNPVKLKRLVTNIRPDGHNLPLTLQTEHHRSSTESSRLTADCDVGRLAHVVAAVEPLDEAAALGDDEHCGRHAVHHHDVAGVRDGQTRHDVDTPDDTDKALHSLPHALRCRRYSLHSYTRPISGATDPIVS